MLKNFESITHELTLTERIIKNFIVKILIGIKGEENAITNADISSLAFDRFKEATGNEHKLSAPRLRRIIHFIRVNNEVSALCSKSKGYFVAGSYEELQDCIDSLIQREVRISLENQRN